MGCTGSLILNRNGMAQLRWYNGDSLQQRRPRGAWPNGYSGSEWEKWQGSSWAISISWWRPTLTEAKMKTVICRAGWSYSTLLEDLQSSEVQLQVKRSCENWPVWEGKEKGWVVAYSFNAAQQHSYVEGLELKIHNWPPPSQTNWLYGKHRVTSNQGQGGAADYAWWYHRISRRREGENIWLWHDLAVAKLTMHIWEMENPKFDYLFINLVTFHLEGSYFATL